MRRLVRVRDIAGHRLRRDISVELYLWQTFQDVFAGLGLDDRSVRSVQLFTPIDSSQDEAIEVDCNQAVGEAMEDIVAFGRPEPMLVVFIAGSTAREVQAPPDDSSNAFSALMRRGQQAYGRVHYLSDESIGTMYTSSASTKVQLKAEAVVLHMCSTLQVSKRVTVPRVSARMMNHASVMVP